MNSDDAERVAELFRWSDMHRDELERTAKEQAATINALRAERDEAVALVFEVHDLVARKGVHGEDWRAAGRCAVSGIVSQRMDATEQLAERTAEVEALRAERYAATDEAHTLRNEWLPVRAELDVLWGPDPEHLVDINVSEPGDYALVVTELVDMFRRSDAAEQEARKQAAKLKLQLAERDRTIGELRGRVKILERDNAELERDRDYWKECALAFQERAETSDQLGDTLKRTHELWTKEREKRFQLTGRLATVADEAFGPFSVQSAEENLTAIERGVFELKHQLAERDRTIGRVTELVGELNDWAQGEPHTGMGAGLHSEKFASLHPGARRQLKEYVTMLRAALSNPGEGGGK